MAEQRKMVPTPLREYLVPIFERFNGQLQELEAKRDQYIAEEAKIGEQYERKLNDVQALYQLRGTLLYHYRELSKLHLDIYEGNPTQLNWLLEQLDLSSVEKDRYYHAILNHKKYNGNFLDEPEEAARKLLSLLTGHIDEVTKQWHTAQNQLDQFGKENALNELQRKEFQIERKIREFQDRGLMVESYLRGVNHAKFDELSPRLLCQKLLDLGFQERDVRLLALSLQYPDVDLLIPVFSKSDVKQQMELIDEEPVQKLSFETIRELLQSLGFDLSMIDNDNEDMDSFYHNVSRSSLQENFQTLRQLGFSVQAIGRNIHCLEMNRFADVYQKIDEKLRLFGKSRSQTVVPVQFYMDVSLNDLDRYFTFCQAKKIDPSILEMMTLKCPFERFEKRYQMFEEADFQMKSIMQKGQTLLNIPSVKIENVKENLEIMKRFHIPFVTSNPDGMKQLRSYSVLAAMPRYLLHHIDTAIEFDYLSQLSEQIGCVRISSARNCALEYRHALANQVELRNINLFVHRSHFAPSPNLVPSSQEAIITLKELGIKDDTLSILSKYYYSKRVGIVDFTLDEEKELLKDLYEAELLEQFPALASHDPNIVFDSNPVTIPNANYYEIGGIRISKDKVDRNLRLLLKQNADLDDIDLLTTACVYSSYYSKDQVHQIYEAIRTKHKRMEGRSI